MPDEFMQSKGIEIEVDEDRQLEWRRNICRAEKEALEVMKIESWNGEATAGECVRYFREHPVFENLFRGFWDKYRSYGSFTGTVTLRSLTQEELEDLEGFFRKNYHGKKTVSVSANQFEKALGESRFGEVEPKEVLELYFGEKLAGKKEQKQKEEQEWLQIFHEAQEKYAGTPGAEWIARMQDEKKGMGAYLQKEYRNSGKNTQSLQQTLLLGAEIINRFPFRQGKSEYLAVYAAELTGNPHSFDRGTKGGEFLNLLVQWTIQEQKICMGASGLFRALHKQRQYFSVGILVDDISNYVMLSGVRAWKKSGELHSGMEGFLVEGDMVQVPLSVIAGWEQAACPDGKIYIVENPSIYAMLCGKWKGKKACMCMNGQPRLSAVLMLDLLAKTGTKVYYAGDFDPEGLLIAQKVKQYYKGAFAYWHMSVVEYEKSRSREEISNRRMKMLDKVTDLELIELVTAMRREKVAGYQENILLQYHE